jgi:hypothetical protein
MFVRIATFLLLVQVFAITGYVSIPRALRKVDTALQRYYQHPSHNPLVHSLLNILVHDRKSRAFITEDAIRMALEEIRTFDQTYRTQLEPALRDAVFGKPCQSQSNRCATPLQANTFRPTPELKEKIADALDDFFADPSIHENVPTVKLSIAANN